MWFWLNGHGTKSQKERFPIYSLKLDDEKQIEPASESPVPHSWTGCSTDILFFCFLEFSSVLVYQQRMLKCNFLILKFLIRFSSYDIALNNLLSIYIPICLSLESLSLTCHWNGATRKSQIIYQNISYLILLNTIFHAI